MVFLWGQKHKWSPFGLASNCRWPTEASDRIALVKHSQLQPRLWRDGPTMKTQSFSLHRKNKQFPARELGKAETRLSSQGSTPTVRPGTLLSHDDFVAKEGIPRTAQLQSIPFSSFPILLFIYIIKLAWLTHSRKTKKKSIQNYNIIVMYLTWGWTYVLEPHQWQRS